MVDRSLEIGQPHPRLAQTLSFVPGSAAIAAAGLMVLGAALPWLRDAAVDDLLPDRAFGLPYATLTAICAGITLLAGVRLVLGHRRLASVACLVVGAVVIVAVGDLWTAVEDAAWSSDVPNDVAMGAWLAVMGALIAVATGVFAIQAHPPGWMVSAILAIDIGDVEFYRALPRRARLALLLGPTLTILLPTAAIVVLAALMGSSDP